MTHPHPPICFSGERLPGGFGTHMEGPSHSKAAGRAPGEKEYRSEISILSRALSCRGQAASQGEQNGSQLRLCGSAWRMAFSPAPAWSRCWQGWVSACLLIRGHILVWVGHWHLQMNNNDPDDGNATCLLWVSHCAQHFPFIISFNFTSKYSYYPHFRGERNEVTE